MHTNYLLLNIYDCSPDDDDGTRKYIFRGLYYCNGTTFSNFIFLVGKKENHNKDNL